MSRAGSNDDVCSIVQRFLSSYKTNETDEPDTCLNAWRVGLKRKQCKVDRLVAVVQHAQSEQIALFILADSQSTSEEDGQASLEVLALDEAFRCDPIGSDAPLTVRISGQSGFTPSTASNQPRDRRGKLILMSAPPPPPAAQNVVDSDEPSEPVGLVYLSDAPATSREKSEESGRLHQLRPRHLRSFLLIFQSVQEADSFRQGVLQPDVASVSKPDGQVASGGGLEVGKDVVAVLVAKRDAETWLGKYLPATSGSTTRSSGGRAQTRQKAIRHSPSSLNRPCREESSLVGGSASLHSDSGTSANSSPNYSSSNKMAINNKNDDNSSVAGMSNGSAASAGEVSEAALRRVPAVSEAGAVRKMSSSQSYQDLTKAPPKPDLREAQRSLKQRRSYMPDHEYRLRLSQMDVGVREKLTKRIDKYSKLSSLTVFVGTWNVNGRQDSRVCLDDWLTPPEGQPPADVYIFGFQELDLSMGSVALNKTTPTALEDRWIGQLESALGGLLQPMTGRASRQFSTWARLPEEAHDYRIHWARHTGGGFIRLRRVRLAGLLMVVYLSARVCRQQLETSEVAACVVATGIWNMLGNKGAVGVRLTLCNTSFCFINCHLAAGEANCERRYQDFNEIIRKMLFERRRDPINPLDVEYVNMDAHDNCFLFGDLNFRIVGLDLQSVCRLIETKDYQQLLRYDELNTQPAIRRSFQGLAEGEITFAPTYKFDMHTNTYITSEKQRTPSYCDRIFFWKEKQTKTIAYRSHPSLTMSDHKPVSGYFKVEIRRVNKSRFQRELEAVVRSQDLVFNLRLPQARLDRQEVDFGPVHFYEVCRRSLTLTNTGLDGLQFQVVQEAVKLPSWLTVTPECMFVDKDNSAQIDLEIFVKPDLVAELNKGVTDLWVIIVLHLTGGKDFFITIKGSFVPSCFGLPLSLLLTLGPGEPVASLSVGELRQRIRSGRCIDWNEAECSVVPNIDERPFFIPKEVVRLTDFISQHWEVPDLLRGSGQYEEFSVIRDLLDTTPSNVEFPDTISVHSVGYCLLMLLNTMTDAVIPQKFQDNCLDACHSFSTVTQALASLPIDHQNLFFYIVAFLRRCLEYRDKNGIDVDFLCNSFGEIIFRENYPTTATTESHDTNNSTATQAHRPTVPVPLIGASRQDKILMFMQHFLSNVV